MSKVIALTGGVGSGKTFVASIFQKLAGIPCFCSDLEAKKIMNKNDYIKEEIISLLGPESFVNNKLNSQFIRNKISGILIISMPKGYLIYFIVITKRFNFI